MLLSSGAGWR